MGPPEEAGIKKTMQAAIDIGTNSVLLLIGERLPDGTVRPVEDRARVTRLGEGLAACGAISDAAAERTLSALREYMELCDRHKVEGIAAIGTAALRNASNARDFLLMAKKAMGLSIEVISPEREAELTFLAAASDFGREIVVIDIGGGSTELITELKGVRELVSMPIGCVVLTENHVKSDPPSQHDVDSLRGCVRHELSKGIEPHIFARPHEAKLVATAGTATAIMAMHLALDPYIPEAVHGSLLKITDLRDIVDMLRCKTVAERRSIKGLMPERADVILAGSILLHDAMSYLGYADATISDRGVKWGLFYERFCKA